MPKMPATMPNSAIMFEIGREMKRDKIWIEKAKAKSTLFP